jgi:hypothetical protein
MSALRKMLAVQLAGNALLLWLAYEWLGLAESNRFRLTLSALDALAILALFCWLHGATVVLFRTPAEERRLNAAFKAALRRVPLLVGAAIVAIAMYGALAWLPGVVKLRKPAMFNGTLWIIRWIVLPVLLVPVFSAIAAGGGVQWRRNWRYWVTVPVLLLAGLMLPMIVLDWIPRASSFWIEMLSFAARAAVAYLLFVAALVGLSASATQFSTGRSA